MGILEKFYDHLAEKPGSQLVHLPHSSVFYVRAAIEENLGVRLDPYDVERLLYEEGLLKAKDYGIPAWYRRKYFAHEVPPPYKPPPS